MTEPPSLPLPPSLLPQPLDDISCRVLAVLIEKSLTHAGSYPLTLNAILMGANQKQNRDPIMDLSEKQVAQTVHRLQQFKLVCQAPPSAGARANRFEHNVLEQFKWDRREQAVMAELMLRGRQTLGEIRNRAIRMASIPDLSAAGVIVQGLYRCEPPWVEELSREPGRSVPRYRHLLSGDDGGMANAQATGEAAESAPSGPIGGLGDGGGGAGDRAGGSESHSARLSDGGSRWEDRVRRLEDRVAALEQMIRNPTGRADGAAAEEPAACAESMAGEAPPRHDGTGTGRGGGAEEHH